MGRRKIAIAPIEDDRNRSVTFFKRKAGLFKKAHELSVLCSVDVALVIRVKDGKYYEYGSKEIDEILRNYSKDEVLDSKHPEDFAEPPRRPRSSRHTRSQSAASQVSLSEDFSSSGDEGDTLAEPSASVNASPGDKTRAPLGRGVKVHGRQISLGTTSTHSIHTSSDASPQSVNQQSPARTSNHRKSRSRSLTPSQVQLQGRQRGQHPEIMLENPVAIQAKPQLGSPPLMKRDGFDHIHPETGAKMPPQGPSKNAQQQSSIQTSLPPPTHTPHIGAPFTPQQSMAQQARGFPMTQYPVQPFGDAQSPLIGGGVRPKLKVEIPQDVVGRTGPGGNAGGWPDNSLSPSGYLLSSQIIPEPANRLPLGNGEKTPLSASLPSRYLNDILPSPSNLFSNDWGAPWSGIPDSAGVRRQGQQGFPGVPGGMSTSAGGQTPSMGMPSAFPGLTPGGLGVTARGIAGDAALAMQAATQQYQQQQQILQQQQQQQQQQLQQQFQQRQQQQQQQLQRQLKQHKDGLQKDEMSLQPNSPSHTMASVEEEPPNKRHKPS